MTRVKVGATACIKGKETTWIEHKARDKLRQRNIYIHVDKAQGSCKCNCWTAHVTRWRYFLVSLALYPYSHNWPVPKVTSDQWLYLSVVSVPLTALRL